MSDSALATYKAFTSNSSKGREGKKIDKIFVHHMAGQLTIEQCGNVFKNRQASAHYGIGKDGRIGQYVHEADTAWHCGNWSYNCRSIGIECANDGGASTGWHVNDKTIESLIILIVDICRRNNIIKINYTGDLSGNLCLHCWTQATACPGNYMKGKMKFIAEEAQKKLAGKKEEPKKEETKELYRVRKAWNDAKSQVGAFTVLQNAKDMADKTGLNVYNSKGALVYSGAKEVTLYRVRKSWADTKSQVGAFKSLANAKKECDKHPGYSVYDTKGKAVYSCPIKKTVQDKMLEWAKATADGNQYRYKSWVSGDEKTHECPICHQLTGKYKGFNCIGLSFAVWHHGGGLPSACSCGVISDPKWEAMLKGTDAEALKIAQDRIGIKDIKVIRNGGKVIPTSKLMPGDIVSFFNGSNYYHTAVYVGDGKVCDITSSRTPAVKYGVPIYDGLKVAVRYTK